MKLSPKDTVQFNFRELKSPFQKEYKFLPDRKFRFDFYFEFGGKKYGVEYDGLFAKKSRHTSVTGFSKDTEKLNLAALAGFIVLRYTALTYRQLYKDLLTIIKSK